MSTRTETFTIEHSLPSARLDKFLCEKFPAASRVALQRLIEQGHIRVNGQIANPTHHPHAGEQVEVHWPEARPAEAQPEAIPLDILFEDESLLVVNKPAGLVVHPAAGHEEHTLVNALLHHCQGSLSGIGGVARPGIVHRLDKETGGCRGVAKQYEAHPGFARRLPRTSAKNVLPRHSLRRSPPRSRKSMPPSPGTPRTANAWPCATTAKAAPRTQAGACWNGCEPPRSSRRRSTPGARIRFACISSFSVIPSRVTTLMVPSPTPG